MLLITTEQDFASVVNNALEPEKVWVCIRPSEDEYEAKNTHYYAIAVEKSHSKVNFSYFHDDSNDTSEMKQGMEVVQRLPLKFDINTTDAKFHLLCASKVVECPKPNFCCKTVPTGVLAGSSEKVLIFSDTQTPFVSNIPGDVTQIRAFPSNEVFLTVSSDRTIRIWPMQQDAVPARELVGHTGAVTSVEVVGKGRNVVSGSLDGSVRLWKCSTQETVHTFRRLRGLEDPVTCLRIEKTFKDEEEKGRESEEHRADHFECRNTKLYAGYKSGTIQTFDLEQHHQIDTYTYQLPVSSMDISSDFVVGGYGEGRIVLWTKSGEIFSEVTLNEFYSVENLKIHKSSESQVVIVASNGPETLVKATIGKNLEKLEFLVGLPQVFKVHDIDISNNTVTVAGDDFMAWYSI